MKIKQFLKRFEFRKVIVVLVYALLFFLMGDVLHRLLDNAMPNNPELSVVLVNVIIYVVMFIFLMIILHKEVKNDMHELSKNDPIHCLLFVIFALILSYCFNLIFNLIMQYAGGANESVNETAVNNVLLGPYGGMYFFIVVFIGPFVEEMVFRRALTDVFKSWRIPPIIVVFMTGTLFGFIHVISAGDFIMVFPYIVTGILFGFLEYATKSMYVPLIAHYINNGVSAIITIVFGVLGLL